MKIVRRIPSVLFGIYAIFVGIPGATTNSWRLIVAAAVSTGLAFYFWPQAEGKKS